jgi:hypothetical protein
MSTAEVIREDLLTIGAVCARLKDEFPDISISKIRYLEDQGLLTPKRTDGGYRLFASSARSSRRRPGRSAGGAGRRACRSPTASSTWSSSANAPGSRRGWYAGSRSTGC